MTNRILPIAAVGAVFASLLWASPAGAATIDIGVSLTNGGFTTVGGPSSSGIAIASGDSLGSFSSINVFATGNPVLPFPTLLDSNTINVAGSSGTLYIAVTETGLTSPLSLFNSSFTSNAIPTGWTVTETTYLNPNDGLYGEVTPLGSASFNSIGTSSKSAVANSGTDFSVTELYEITAVGAGVSNDTVDLSGRQTPIPSALPLFIGGLGLLGFAGWFKRRKEASAIKFLAH